MDGHAFYGKYDLLPDPRAFRLYLEDIFDYRFDGAADALWHHTRYALIDLEEIEQFSDFRIAYLARYGRQSMLQWGDVPVSRINQLFNALKQLMKDEGGSNVLFED